VDGTDSSPGFGDLTVAGFVDLLASAEPVPGGGSASAIGASLGAGLVAMVAALSEGRPKYADHAALHAVVAAQARALAHRFIGLADEDAAAYAGFRAAMKLPRDSDANVEVRAAAIREAARSASEVPVAVVVSCRDLVTLAEALAGRSNANAASDLNVAVLLGEAAARGAAENVLVNLPSVDDEAYSTATETRLRSLLAVLAAVAAAARAAVQERRPRAPIPATALTALAALAADATAPTDAPGPVG
jgi:formiminotetrahydrofolate cyclodeaminase